MDISTTSLADALAAAYQRQADLNVILTAAAESTDLADQLADCQQQLVAVRDQLETDQVRWEATLSDLLSERDALQAEVQRLTDLLAAQGDDPMNHYGVCLVLQNGTDYGDLEQVLADLNYLGVRSIRARFQSGARGARVMQWCADRDVSWCVSFSPESWFEVEAPSIEYILDKYEAAFRECMSLPGAQDVVSFIEVANEPNQSRNSTPATNWATRVTDLSLRAASVRDEIAPGLPILSAAMHVNDNGGADWLRVGGSYADAISLHSYPLGDTITTKLDERISAARAAFPGLQVVITEHGWVSSPPYEIPTSGGPRWVTPERCAELVAETPGILYSHPDVDHAFLFELEGGAGSGTQDTRGLVYRGVWTPAGEELRTMTN